jgi:hypothetical protein
LIQGKAVDEDGTQCLIAALEGLPGFQKEATASLVVHDVGLKRLTVNRATTPLNVTLLHGGSQADYSGWRVKRAGKQASVEQSINAQEYLNKNFRNPAKPRNHR